MELSAEVRNFMILSLIMNINLNIFMIPSWCKHYINYQKELKNTEMKCFVNYKFMELSDKQIIRIL
jgi:hypothetical protein